MPAKDQVQVLIEEIAAHGLALDQLRGVAFYDMQKDERLTALRSFAEAEQAIVQIPQFVARFGADNVRRVTLQCVYQYFDRIDGVRYEDAAFNALWEDFAAEIENSTWITRGVANVKNFTSPSLHIDLSDGIAIRGRSFEELSALGFSQAILNRITDDWHSGFGASSFVLVAEDSVDRKSVV